MALDRWTDRYSDSFVVSFLAGNLQAGPTRDRRLGVRPALRRTDARRVADRRRRYPSRSSSLESVRQPRSELPGLSRCVAGLRSGGVRPASDQLITWVWPRSRR